MFFLAQFLVHRDGYLKGYDSLHEHITPKILPKEYGGEAGSISDMWGKRTCLTKPVPCCKEKKMASCYFSLSNHG
jgi:hypothetical protein